jgi:hypothetical protein
MLTWARSGLKPPDMFHPMADEYADIDGLERALDIPVGTPVLINPDGQHRDAAGVAGVVPVAGRRADVAVSGRHGVVGDSCAA